MKRVTDLVYFTQGYCFALAIELHERTGFGLRVLFGSRADHVVVKTPDGQYLDVRGLQTREDLDKRWGDPIVRAVGPHYFDDWFVGVAQDLGRLNKKRLNRVVDRILRDIVTLKCTNCPAVKIVRREPCFYDFKEVETLCPDCREDG